jgi:hypothetical protein
MMSSLVHVLIVTPVIFYWLHARQLPVEESAEHTAAQPVVIDRGPRARRRWRRYAVPVLAALVLIAAGIGWTLTRRTTGGATPLQVTTAVAPIQRVRSGDLDIALTSPTGQLKMGRAAFAIDFRSVSTGALVDVGTVRASATMTMPGMVMSGGLLATPSGTPGRYDAVGDFGMAGAWRWTIEWEGPAGNGSVAFEGTVQ